MNIFTFLAFLCGLGALGAFVFGARATWPAAEGSDSVAWRVHLLRFPHHTRRAAFALKCFGATVQRFPSFT
jgi:hypothetical protein